MRVFIDIETQRTDDQSVIARISSAVKPPGSYKKPESIAEWWAKEGNAARIEAVNRTALDGTYGRLASIGVALGDADPIIWAANTYTEREMLTELNAAVKSPAFAGYVAFNGEFDFRFLYQRSVINRVPVPSLPLQRGSQYFDPMREWAGFKGYIKQTELEYALGITREDPLDGDGALVGDAIDLGDWSKVIAHNKADLVCLREIYRRMSA